MKRINDENGIVCATCGSGDIVYATTGTPLDGGYEIKEGIVHAYKCKQCGNNSFVFYQIAGISRLNKTTLKSLLDGKLPEWEDDNVKAPELTSAVFDLPNCPDWARYAAVDSTGVAFWYEKVPSAVMDRWLEISGRYQVIDGIYHCSDWSKSVIVRPANTVRLPYWCHQGSYVYAKAKDKYAIITDIVGVSEDIYLCNSMSEVSPSIDKSSFLKNWEYVIVVPYEWFDIRNLVGTTIRSKDVIATVMGYDHEKKAVLVNNVWMKPCELILHGFFKEDGKPCGSIISGDPKNEQLYCIHNGL